VSSPAFLDWCGREEWCECEDGELCEGGGDPAMYLAGAVSGSPVPASSGGGRRVEQWEGKVEGGGPWMLLHSTLVLCYSHPGASGRVGLLAR